MIPLVKRTVFMTTAMHFRDHPMHKPLCLGVREGFNACPYFSGLSTKTGLSDFHVSYAGLTPDFVLTRNLSIIIWKALVMGKILRKMWKILSPNN